MFQRIVSAIVALLIVVPILIWGGVTGVQLLVGAALLVVLYEFAPVASPDHPLSAHPWWGLACTLGWRSFP